MHELLHPPLEADQWRTWIYEANFLKTDDYLLNAINDQDRAMGYNNFNSFMNENVTLFLDQLASEQMGIAIDVMDRWGTKKGADYVLAKALYVLAKRYNFPDNRESALQFLTRVITNDDLKVGNIEILNNVFLGLEEDPALVAQQNAVAKKEREEIEKTLPPVCKFKDGVSMPCRVKKKKTN